MDYLIALWVCVAAAAAEGLSAGRDPMGQLKATRQPAWSPPSWAWVLIGLAWYAICFTALARLLPFWPVHKAPVLLLAALMLANAAANLLQFRMRRLDLAFFYLLLAAARGVHVDRLPARPAYLRHVRGLCGLPALCGVLGLSAVADESALSLRRA